MSEIGHLREIAEVATPGEWVAHENRRHAGGIPVSEPTVYATEVEPGWVVADARDGGVSDARFIATFDPPTVLALLDVAEAAQNLSVIAPAPSEIGALSHALERLRKML